MEAAAPQHSSRSARALEPGMQVQVRNSLNLWSPGFQVETWQDDRYQVRRNSDGAVLPRSFATEDVRSA